MSPNLHVLEQEIWNSLQAATQQSDHPFRTGTLGTLGLDNFVALRTVVVRWVRAAGKELWFHSDHRAAKGQELANNPSVSWLFWDAAQKIQLRLGGRARLYHESEETDQMWAETSLASRKEYLMPYAPATPLASPEAGIPAHLRNELPSEEESERGRMYFVAICTEIHFIDWLQLSRAGHRRAQFRYEGNETRGQWVSP